MSERPLPTVIGPTENALRSLLSHILASTPINDYDEWVALTYTASRQTHSAALTFGPLAASCRGQRHWRLGVVL